MFENGYIKLHRSLLSWEWYKDVNTTKLFLHCLLMANFESARFEGIEVPAGSFVTSYQHLSEQTGLTVSQVRVALKHLIITQCVTRSSSSKYTVITIKNWDKFQNVAQSVTNKSQTDNKQITNKSQTNDNNIRNNNKNKEEKEEKEIGSTEPEEDYSEFEEGAIQY